MYQITTRKALTDYVSARYAGEMSEHDLPVEFRGDSAEEWVDDIEVALQQTLQLWVEYDSESVTTDQRRDEVEGILSAILHAGLRHLPAKILTDRDFWRFCSGTMYDFILWRHQSTKTEAALYPYFGIAADSLGQECVPHRMFNRAHIALVGGGVPDSDDPYELAKFGARDVWASHILRVRTSYAPFTAHELLVDVRSKKLPTPKIRALAKALQRIRSNVIFEVLDQDQSRGLIDRTVQRIDTAEMLSEAEGTG